MEKWLTAKEAAEKPGMEGGKHGYSALATLKNKEYLDVLELDHDLQKTIGPELTDNSEDEFFEFRNQIITCAASDKNPQVYTEDDVKKIQLIANELKEDLLERMELLGFLSN